MPKTCFVIMPFHTSFDGIWQTVIRPTIEDVGDTCFRSDDVFQPGTVVNQIFRSIEDADYLIADLTGHNPNVCYELGYATALNKQVILLTQDDSGVPFDLKSQRVLKYEDNAAGVFALRKSLERSVAAL